MSDIEEKLKEFFRETSFDAIEVYYEGFTDEWTCCIMTGCQGEPKPTIEEAIVSAIEEGK